MARSKARSHRKYTGHKYKYFMKKRKRVLERPAINTVIGEEHKKNQRTMGGNTKLKLFASNFINVADPSTHKITKTKILKFDHNAASKDLNRRHIITKGTIVDTELGKVKVTSRPGQQGILNGIVLTSS